MRLFLILLACLAIAAPSRAQDEIGEVTSEPLCFDVINEAAFEITARIMSDFYYTPDGTKAYHRSNFRLKPMEKAKACSTGPFYEGRKLDLSIRGLVPLFSCKTALDGPVTLHSRPKQGGGNQFWAECR